MDSVNYLIYGTPEFNNNNNNYNNYNDNNNNETFIMRKFHKMFKCA